MKQTAIQGAQSLAIGHLNQAATASPWCPAFLVAIFQLAQAYELHALELRTKLIYLGLGN